MSQKPEIDYRCAVCGVKVEVIEGKFVRPCEHQEAGVTASMSATAYGESKVVK